MAYTVSVSKERNNWLASVLTLDGVSTWAESFEELEIFVREAIALAEDMPAGAEDSIDIEWVVNDASPGAVEPPSMTQPRPLEP